MAVNTADTSRQKIRARIRRQRRQLNDSERAACAWQLAMHAGKDRLVQNSQHIAVYLPADGEIDPQPLMQQLWAQGKTLYLPVLVTFPAPRLWFTAYAPGDRLVANRFGIAEPARTHYRRIKPMGLDLVMAPLVAFDLGGDRLGMGGGYYDRTFGFLNKRKHWRKPDLMGLAYELQKQKHIQPEPWDVKLSAVATEAAVYHCQ